MYRIELSPGEVTVFRTIEELATGVRNGVISPRARIYHHATEKWLPIEFHPHYKKAIESLGSKKAPRAMAHPVPVGAGSAPLPAPILAPLSEPMHFPRPRPVATPQPTPVPAPRATPTPMPWEVAKAPTPMPWEVAEAPAPAPTVDSPVLYLQKLAYPEITPAQEPVAHPSPARAHAGGRRPLQLGVVASVIIGCTFVVMRASARPDAPEAVVAPRPEAIGSARPAPAPVSLPKSSPRPRVPALSSKAAPASGASAMTSSPGPAFAPATIGPKPAAAKTPVVAPAKSAAAADSTSAIEPPPAELDLSVPAPPQADSLSTLPKSTTDSVALGRILRAVGGTRPAQKPAP
jgi:hypothetical protein